jgi:hypothetical protein
MFSSTTPEKYSAPVSMQKGRGKCHPSALDHNLLLAWYLVDLLSFFSTVIGQQGLNWKSRPGRWHWGLSFYCITCVSGNLWFFNNVVVP